MSFNLTSLIPGVGTEYEHVATFGAVAVLITGLGLMVKSSVKAMGEKAVIPEGHLSFRGVFEFITEFIQGLVDTVIGPHGRKYTPMFAAIFTIILANNLIGIVPGMSPPTERFSTSLAMGSFMFIVYNYLGLKEHGLTYLKHFMGPLLWLAPLMLSVELISHIARPLSLGLRLASVMKGDHTVVGVFLDMVPLILPIPFYALGMFACFVQAFVFTLLSMVYVSLATTHDH